MSNMQNKIWQSRRNLNRIGSNMKRAQEICRGRECVKVFQCILESIKTFLN